MLSSVKDMVHQSRWHDESPIISDENQYASDAVLNKYISASRACYTFRYCSDNETSNVLHKLTTEICEAIAEVSIVMVSYLRIIDASVEGDSSLSSAWFRCIL